MTFVRRHSPDHQNVDVVRYKLIEHLSVRRDRLETIDVMEGSDHEAPRAIGALFNQLLRVVFRVRKIKVAICTRDLFDLLAPRSTDMLVVSAEANEEFRWSDVVIFENLSTLEFVKQPEPDVPAHRVVIDQNIVRAYEEVLDFSCR
jgi:hypothetical protein